MHYLCASYTKGKGKRKVIKISWPTSTIVKFTQGSDKIRMFFNTSPRKSYYLFVVFRDLIDKLYVISKIKTITGQVFHG